MLAERWGEVASWVFLLGVLLVFAAALPPVRRYRAALMLGGFGLAVLSFGLVFLGWGLRGG